MKPDPLMRLEELRKQSAHVAALVESTDLEQKLSDREKLMRDTLLEHGRAMRQIREELELNWPAPEEE